jgi:3-oxoacyl-[acyl-carrier-protein] synthase III
MQRGNDNRAETPMYMSAIAYVLGERRPIEELDALRRNADMLQAFKAARFELYCKSSMSPIELACLSMSQTMAKTSIKPSDIDYVLYCCEYNPDLQSHKHLHLECARLGLHAAMPVGLYFTGCGNVASGMAMAQSLIRSGQARNVLLLTSDCSADENKRVVPPSIAIMSDGASSCLLTADRPAGDDGFQVIDTQIDVFHRMATLDPVLNPKEYKIAMFDRTRVVFDKICSSAGLQSSDVDALISQNLEITTLTMMCHRFRLDPSINYTDNLPAIGHAGLADNLINLLDSLQRGRLPEQARVLMLATGPYSFGLTALRRLARG